MKEIIFTITSGVIAIASGTLAKIKSRINACKEACKQAVEKAEDLNGTGEQKKAYAMALVRKTIRYFSDKRISKYIEEYVKFSKIVNAKIKEETKY